MFFKYNDKMIINLDNLRMVCIDNPITEPSLWYLTFHYVDGSTIRTPATRDFNSVNEAFRTLNNNFKVIN